MCGMVVAALQLQGVQRLVKMEEGRFSKGSTIVLQNSAPKLIPERGSAAGRTSRARLSFRYAMRISSSSGVTNLSATKKE